MRALVGCVLQITQGTIMSLTGITSRNFSVTIYARSKLGIHWRMCIAIGIIPSLSEPLVPMAFAKRVGLHNGAITIGPLFQHRVV
jgi:hypothetical protein